MEKEVQFKSKGVTLRGVLNMPEGPEPHPLLVMGAIGRMPTAYKISRGCCLC